MDRAPGVTQYIEGPWADELAHWEFVKKRTLGPYPQGFGYWAIALKDEPDTFLGWVLLIPNNTVDPEVEIGWRVCPSAWGRGYASEAATRLLLHAFETLTVPYLVADIHPHNLASIRVAEKLGMRRRQCGDADNAKQLRFVYTNDEFHGLAQDDDSL